MCHEVEQKVRVPLRHVQQQDPLTISLRESLTSRFWKGVPLCGRQKGRCDRHGEGIAAKDVPLASTGQARSSVLAHTPMLVCEGAVVVLYHALRNTAELRVPQALAVYDALAPVLGPRAGPAPVCPLAAEDDDHPQGTPAVLSHRRIVSATNV